MKYKCLLIFYFSFIFLAKANDPDDSIFVQLDKLLEQKDDLIRQKWQRIESLNQQLRDSEKKKELQYQFQTCANLFEEYKSFQYDSAFKYTNKMLMLAFVLNDKSKINNTKVNMSFILLSSGMFKEALDTLNTIDSLALSVLERINFYKVFARTYFDLSDFSQDQHYNQVYSTIGNLYLSRALNLSEKGSAEYLFLKAWEYMRVRNIEQAIGTFQKLFHDYQLTEHQYAIATSSLSFMYRLDNNQLKTKEYLAKAAMADIRASVLETVALRDLAEILYKENKHERAYRYIKIASDDAYSYGAKFREVQIAHILPIIESAHMIEVEGKRKNLVIYSSIATFISLMILILAFIISRQNRKLKHAKEGLIESHARLQELNNKLLDANEIKEEYIGHFFKTISEYIDKIDRFKTSVDRKISQKKLEQIQDIVNQINLKAERDELYGSFDRIFLKIFPDFIKKFNTFFNEEDQYVIPENAPLPPELRIFALIRLGITDNEKIARFLGYSVNTIYTYKTRLKNKTISPNEKLEISVMEVKAH
jgi:DNA-binding CsgD family transcriptional regulator